MALKLLTEDTRHLGVLPEIRKELLAAATGRDQMPVDVVMKIIKAQNWIIFGLVMVIVFLLTGSNFGWIGHLHQ